MDGNDNEDGSGLEFEEDEDEFGLPSVIPTRKKRADKSESSPGPEQPTVYTPPAQPTNQDLWRIESGDLAEERGLPNYPTTKRSEGKILRPQYKDILKGNEPALVLPGSPNICYRPCEFVASDLSPFITPECQLEGNRGTFGTHYAHQQVQTHLASQLHLSARSSRISLVWSARRGACHVVAGLARLPSYQ